MKESEWKLFNSIIENIDADKNLEEAERDLDNLLVDGIEPIYTYYVLGSLYLKKKQYGKAAHFLQLAFDLTNGKEYQIVCNLATAYQCAGFADKALGLYDVAAKIPMKPFPYINYTNCLIKLGRFTEARDIARRGIKEGVTSQELVHNLSHALLSLGEYAEGFELNENRLAIAEHPNKFHEVDLPYWNGEKGVTVVVYEEQGLGDEIMFASMLPDLIRDCKVIYDCNPRLEKLMQRSFPQIPVYGNEPEDVVEFYSSGRHKIDYKVSIGSLAKFYRKSEKDFPRTAYLKADPELVEKYRVKLAAMGDKKKIGFSWYGGGTDRARLMARFNALNNWSQIFSLPFDFISLQYNPEAETKIKNFCKNSGKVLHHWADMVRDLDEVAALMMNLDMVVSAPQTAVHLAGALGVPTIRLCAVSALWMHGEYNKDAPWYGSVENIWQSKSGKWDDVMNKVYDKLEGLC